MIDRRARLDRRALLRLVAAVPALAAGASACSEEPVAAVATVNPPKPFLTDAERRALGALADVILPPDDLPGGQALGAVDYVERVLTAFEVSPPAIFAGGPYSDRNPIPDANGAPTKRFPPNAFAKFLPLDRYAEAAWRLTVLGSSGVPGGGPNDAVLGPVVGWREQIRSGLATAEGLVGMPLETLPPATLASLYRMLDPDFRSLVYDLVTEGVFAAPEYGGNTDLGGWKLAHYEGDVMPFGYSQFDPATQKYVERADAPVSKANPGADPEPITADTWAFISTVVQALGGTEFP